MDIKIKDLIKILQGCNPEGSVIFSIGETNAEMTDICKAAIIKNTCGRVMCIENINIVSFSDEHYDIKMYISIGPTDWADVINTSKQFDNTYIKK